MTASPRPVFLKLGGSLITDKTQPLSPRSDIIQSLAKEIADAVNTKPGLSLIIGHGSGSFGHAVAKQHQTQFGGDGQAYWQGFSEVWRAARALNQLVVQALSAVDLPVLAFPPSAGLISENGHVKQWDLQPIKLALSHGLIPVVYGDVVFDTALGGTILSTEELFQHLARESHPRQILITGLEEGVYDHPQKPSTIIPLITPHNMEAVRPTLSTSQAVDVTGGMLAKVEAMVALVDEIPSLRVRIFSGQTPGRVRQALIEPQAPLGTLIAHPAMLEDEQP
jgi:isopentenyl phosphate kinase